MILYRKYYANIQFERAGLFKTIRKNYRCNDVLYPGCSVHITPSFYFPHVVYVDQNPVTGAFFADSKGVLDYINRNKTYRRPSHIRFISQDYSKALPLQGQKFDLLISLFADDIFRTCKKHLKIGGFMLTQNHRKDAGEAASDKGFRLISVLQFCRNKYTLFEDDLEKRLAATGKAEKRKDYLRQTGYGVAYSEGEDYLVFIKCAETNRQNRTRSSKTP